MIRAALSAESAAGRLLARLLVDGGTDCLVVSSMLVLELTDVLSRRKFAGRITAVQQRRFVLQVQAAAQWVEPSERVHDCRDQTDDWVLEAALAVMHAHAATVVIASDDQDLLTLDPWRGVRIVKPEATLAMLEAGQR